ncbi:MAG: BON domain-containing protein [Desulfobulbaceae bacterium]|nr:BON domain-containing protein [Desulfobulbaceae bacterium]
MFLVIDMSGCAIYSAAVDQRNVRTIASDTKIKVAIEKAFVKDKTINILKISPFVYNGHAYLTGEYGKDAQKRRAISLARKTKGVKDLTTYLLPVNKGDYCGVTDNAAMATKVKSELIRDKKIWAGNINVEAVQCHIVLLGIVGTKAERNKVVAHAKGVDKVRSVKSFLQVGK